VTNPPQGPSHPAGHNPSPWARPVQPPSTERIAGQGPPSTERIAGQGPPSTERISGQGSPSAAPTERFARRPGVPEQSTQSIPRPAPPSTDAPRAAQPQSHPARTPARKEGKLRRLVSDPLSIVLILVIVFALAVAGLLGGELYGRHRANAVVAKIVECVVHDSADVSFGTMPPFLWQHLNRRYTNIAIHTAGNQVRDARGMKLDIDIKDVHLQNSGDSAGTIGSLVASVAWTADGIKRTLQDSIPLLGGIVSDVKTNQLDGTVEIDGPLGTVVARPQLTDGSLGLKVVHVVGLGFTLPSESVQPALDAVTSRLTKDYPLGIKADSVAVTGDGVVAQFSTHDATIPPDNQDPCFVGL
jgi:LmeA-like phospholipid-binding